ncbi:MAG: GNAT family N-acetyltransferase [Ignavibacteria bacterium]
MDSKENNHSKLKDNKERKQFELVTDGFTSRVEYMIAGNKIFLTHTEVPLELEGKGIGSEIIKLALVEIEARGLKLIPLCPFAASYIKRHPEWKRILDSDVNLK